MIRAGDFTIHDNGFTVVTESIGGVARQAIVAELPGGISDEALAALCTGPIEVLGDDGSVVTSHTGPFRVVSHGLKLTRASAGDDVAALTAQVETLQAQLSHAQSEKQSAQSALASLNAELSSLKTTMAATLQAKDTDKAVTVEEKPAVEVADAAGSL